jgi:hypothetical protein
MIQIAALVTPLIELGHVCFDGRQRGRRVADEHDHSDDHECEHQEREGQGKKVVHGCCAPARLRRDRLAHNSVMAAGRTMTRRRSTQPTLPSAPIKIIKAMAVPTKTAKPYRARIDLSLSTWESACNLIGRRRLVF